MNNIKEFIPESIYFAFLLLRYRDVEQATFDNLTSVDGIFGQATVDSLKENE